MCSAAASRPPDMTLLRGLQPGDTAAQAALLKKLHAVQSGLSFSSFTLPSLSDEELRFVDSFFRRLGPSVPFCTR